MARRSSPRRQPLSLPIQISKMRDSYPGLRRASWERGLIVWEGPLQPVDAAEEYRVSIAYQFRLAPRVRVLEPELRANQSGECVPHRYPDGCLCLYYPRYSEWAPNMAIADTIVPWISLWLYYYEVWHATGEWLGGGVVHSGPKLSRASSVR